VLTCHIAIIARSSSKYKPHCAQSFVHRMLIKDRGKLNFKNSKSRYFANYAIQSFWRTSILRFWEIWK